MSTSGKGHAQTKLILGQPSWSLVSSDVEAHVTCLGGMVGPVIFDRHGRKLSPYSVAPWAREKLPPQTPAILRVLRGDFFCMPFGANSTPFHGEKHPLHGSTANSAWKLESLSRSRGEATLHLSLRTKPRPGRVDKTITLVDGHPAVYCRHIISEMSGPMNFAHHPMLKFPDEEECGQISTSRFVFGQVFPGSFENPAEGGYSALRPGTKFTDLAKVPALDGSEADLSRYPARRGFEDLVMIVADRDRSLAWTAAAFPKHGYVWFSLKDPKVLAETILWISNGGRHYAPWNGRHVAVMGLEEATANFAYGLAESARPNPLSRSGHPTCIPMNVRRPLTVNYVMACVPTPRGFDAVKSIQPDATGDSVTLHSRSGKTVQVPLDVRFVHGGLPAKA